MQGDHLYSRKYYWFSYFSYFLNPEFPIFLFFWASWHCTPCKHSISIVHIFHVISFKAFCKFLRLRNSVWDFWGGFVGSLRAFFGFWCLPPFNHLHHLKSRVSPALGGGRVYSQEALVWYFIYACMAYEVGIFLGEAGYWSVSLF